MLAEPKFMRRPMRAEAARDIKPPESNAEMEELLHDLDDDFARLALEVDSEEFVYRPEEEELILFAAGQTC
jgi:hypothetical protein